MRRIPLLPIAAIGSLALSAAAAVPLQGQQPEAPLQALRMDSGEAVDLDGRLGEEVWGRAIAIDDFRQEEPVEGAPATERTEVRVIFDENALYIGAMIFDRPDSILAFQKRRDAGLGTDDRFMWILDTFRDGRTGYFFEINAAGLMGDGLLGAGGRFGVNKSWDGIWEARTARLEDGWSAEIRIPFQTLNFNPESEAWGINFQRTIRRRNEELRWRGWRRDEGLFNPVFAGQMVGIGGVSQGVGVEVTPYVVQNWRTILADEDPTTFPGDVGVDVGYNVTPSLRAAVSVNTDFAEVEVDQRRVNLTRFPLRFPEQRDFFLEGSGVYSFAPRSGPSPYFSRRIGLEQGEPVPIKYAARLGGQAGRYELGFLQVATGSDHGVPDENFTVARVKRGLFEQSSLGAVYTRRSTAIDDEGFGAEDRHTVGADLDFQTRNFLGGKNLELEAFVAWNSNPDPEEDLSTSDLTARGFRLNFPNDIWQAHLSYREFGSAYRPAVGFVPRNDFRRVEPRVGWAPRPSISWIRQLEFSLQFRYLEGLTFGDVQERQWDLGLLQVNLESGDFFQLTSSRKYEFLDRDFTVGEDVPILPGAYTNWETSLRFRSAGQRRFSLNGNWSRGGFWDGTRQRYQTELTFRPVPGISISGDYELNRVQLPRGDFDTQLVRMNGGW
ncbi:MAG: carbohydrate binding family 9 domain-containing protein, partial [Gemmatimonadetes bacterium]|nr:carbohydrate binding family 9 domain-containing protein [Gemmatimonadota bacterium]